MFGDNFRYSQDPFGLFSVRSDRSSSSGGKNSFWKIFLIILAIIGIILLFIFRDVILKFFFGKTEDKPKEEEKSNALVVNMLEEHNPKKEPLTLESAKSLVEKNIQQVFPIADKATWDLDFINAKEKEGKALFVEQEGWIIYE